VADERDTWTRIARHLEAQRSGDLSSSEKQAFREWLRESPDRRTKWEAARKIWRDLPEACPQPPSEASDVEQAWAVVARELGLPAEHHPEKLSNDRTSRRSESGLKRERSRRRPSRDRSSRWAVAGVAAGLVIAMAITLWGRMAAEPSLQTRSTAPAERDTVRLADGSLVTLGPDSKLSYPASFSTDGRGVRLQGRAYFVVSKDSTRPFRVRTPRAVTEVLGTEFSVDAYASEPDTRIVVSDGRVAVRSDSTHQRSVVAKGEAATVRRGRIQTSSVPEIDAELAWRFGRLAFRNEPLPSVLRSLERWYGVDFRIADSTLSDRRLTATFQDESVSQAIDVLRLTLNLSIHRRDAAFVVAPRGGAEDP